MSSLAFVPHRAGRAPVLRRVPPNEVVSHDGALAVTEAAPPPRNGNLDLLATVSLDVDGVRYPVSPPHRGDLLTTANPARWITLGIAEGDVPRLAGLAGRTGRLVDSVGRALAMVRIQRVDPTMTVLIAENASGGAPGQTGREVT